MDSKVITDVKDMVKNDQSKLHIKLEKMVIGILFYLLLLLIFILTMVKEVMKLHPLQAPFQRTVGIT